MELGIIRKINIDTEMQASYLDYAMSVIVARALPDVRDGLKPVHRRILYAMHDLGLSPDKPYKKSARIVGEVLGKYHPHGDSAVYEAMVRMAQDFSLRYPLVDGQGNFGSIDGDNAAAMRYTEARLAKIAIEMLADIEKDTVDWTDNFDGTLKEPLVLPAALPNLLVNGASGIAVGMSTNIPPHNLGEVCDALCYLIDHYDHHDDVTVEDLMQFIPGPDFPTGGVAFRYAQAGNGEEEREDVIAKAYASGRGSIVMQAKAHIEDMSRNRSRIVVTELPYQTNKTNLIERIAELARDGRLEGLTDLRDESDRTGMRICIEMTRTVEPRKVLADLFKLTPLQQTFGVSLLALVDGEPRLLSLKRMLVHFLEHRQDVIARRSKYELEKAKQRAHIVEGLLRALDALDEIIALIRKSRTVDDARQGLIKQFNFTEIQAQAILDMQLRRLAALERRKLQDEYRELVALIRELEALLKSPKKVLGLIRQNLLDLKARYGDARRTQIADRERGTLTAHDLLPDEEVWVTVSPEGVLTRTRRGVEGQGSRGPAEHLRTPVATLVSANTRDDLYLFSAKGQVTRIGIHQISETGSHYADLSGFSRRDRVAALVPLPKPGPDEATGFLLLATQQGQVKRITLADLIDQAQADPQVIGLAEGDELVWAGLSAGGGEFVLVTAQGQAIRFAEDGVRAMGLPAGGVGGVKLARKDRVVAAAAVPAASVPADPAFNGPAHLAIVTADGFVKRVALAEFPVQGRNGQGVVAAKLTPKSGAMTGAALMGPEDAVVCGLNGGGNRVLGPHDLPEMGRAATGKQVAGLGGLLAVERVLLLAGASSVEPAEPKPAPPAPASKAAAKPAAKPAAAAKPKPVSQKAAPQAEAPAAKPARTRSTTPAVAAEPTSASAQPVRPAQTKSGRATPAKAVPAPEPVEAPKAAPKPVRSRGKAAVVDTAQLALLAEAAPEAPEKKPRAAAKGAAAKGAAAKGAATKKAVPAPTPAPPKAAPVKAKAAPAPAPKTTRNKVTAVAQPEPAAAPAKPAGRAAKQTGVEPSTAKPNKAETPSSSAPARPAAKAVPATPARKKKSGG